MVAHRATLLIAALLLFQCLGSYSEEPIVEFCDKQEEATDIVMLQLVSDLKVGQEVAPAENASRKAGAHSVAGALMKKINVSQIPATEFGNPGCRCIGFDAIEGETPVEFGNKTAIYPSDLGSSCFPWDEGVHPDCTGRNPPTWCANRWCFVDACACNLSTNTPPKISSFMPDAQFQGRQLYYSYATCGDLDSWTAENNKIACVNRKNETSCVESDKCKWTFEGNCRGKEFTGEGCDAAALEELDEHTWGKEDCRCIGIEGQFGVTEVFLNNSWLAYPGDTGTFCNAWDEDRHPECQGPTECQDVLHPWCKQKWCYVDPCKCHLASPPTINDYIPLANYQGHPLYYSYETCDEVSSYKAAERSEACALQTSPEECAALEKCTWVSKRSGGWSVCVDKELSAVCDVEFQQGSALRAFSSQGVLLWFGIFALGLQ